MLGFNAFSQTPLSTQERDAESQQVNDFTGVLGAGVLGDLAIGETGDVTGVNVGLDTDAQANAGLVDIPTIVTRPLASALSGALGDGAFPDITVTQPEATLSAEAVVSIDAHKATRTFTVTVSNDGYGNKYYIDGVKQASLSLHEEGVYRFDVSDSSVSGHPFRFSTTSNGTHNSGSEYTTNVTVVGTAGNAGAYVEIEVTASTPDLYYYCGVHSGMGGSITFVSDFGQVPFIIEVTSFAGLADGGATGESEVGAVTLTAAEASASGAAEATFADSIEVGLTAPQSSATVSATASATLVTTSVTSPESSSTGTASVSVDAATVNIFTPTPRISGVEVPDAMPNISVTAPEATIGAGQTATVSDTLSIAVTAPEIDVRITTLDDYAGRVDRFTTKHNFETTTVTLSFPTTFTVPFSVSSTYAGSWTASYNANFPARIVDWETLYNGKRRALVFFFGKKTTNANNDTWYAVWEFDNAGSLTLKKIAPFLQWASPTDGTWQLASSGYIDNDQVITPLMYTASSGTYAGTYLYRNKATFGNGFLSQINRNSLTDTEFSVLKVSNNTDDVSLITIGQADGWNAYQYALPWRGDWGSRSTQNYLLWSYQVGSTYYLKLAAENGDVISVNSTTSLSSHKSEAKKFTDGSYENECVGDSADPAKWWHDGTQDEIDDAEKYVSLSESVQTFDTDMEVDITDSSLQVAELLTSIITPDGVGVQNATASAALVTVDITAPETTGSALAEAALVSVVVTTAESTATGSGSASAGVGTVTVTQPASTATGGAIGSADVASVTVSSPESTSTGDGSVSTAVGTVNLTSPEPSINASVSDDVGTVTVTAPEPTIAGDASADLVTISVTTPDVEGFSVTGSSEVGEVTITTPTPVISGVEVPDAMPTINVASPDSTVSAECSVSVSDSLQVDTVAPVGSAKSEKVGFAGIPQLDVSSPEPTVSANALKEVQTDPVSVTAPEASVSNQASATLVNVAITSPSPFTVMVAEVDAPSISQTAPTPTIKASSTAEDSPLGGIDVFGPEPTLITQTSVLDTLEVSIISPEPTAEGLIGGEVSDVPQVTVIAAEGSGRESGKVTEVSAGNIDVIAPEPTVDTGAIGTASIPQVELIAPEGSESVSTFTGLTPSTTINLSIEGEAFCNITAVPQPFVVIDLSIISSASGTAEAIISDDIVAQITAPEATLTGTALKLISETIEVGVANPSGFAFAQDVETTFDGDVTTVYNNTTALNFSSAANSSVTPSSAVVVLTPTDVDTPFGGTPIKPLHFSITDPLSANNSVILMAREFTTATDTSLLEEVTITAQDVTPAGYTSTANDSFFDISSIYVDDNNYVTDSDGVKWPTVKVGWAVWSRYTYTVSGQTTQRIHWKWLTSTFNPVTEQFGSVSHLYDIGQGISDGGTFQGGPVGGSERFKYTFEFLHLDHNPSTNQWRLEHHSLRTSDGTKFNNTLPQLNTTNKSTWQTRIVNNTAIIEGRDSDVANIEGDGAASVSLTTQNKNVKVNTSSPAIIVGSPAANIQLSPVALGSIPEVSAGGIDGEGREDRLQEVEAPVIGLSPPIGAGNISPLTEPDGPGTVNVTPPEGAISQLTTVQEITDVINITSVAPEATLTRDFIFGIDGPPAIDMDSPQPLIEVATTSPTLIASITVPTHQLSVSSIAEAELAEILVINPNVTLEVGSTANIDLADVQLVTISSPESSVSVEATITDPLTSLVSAAISAVGVDSVALSTGSNVIVAKPIPTVTSEGNGTADTSVGTINVTAPEPLLTIDSLVQVTTVNAQPVSIVAPQSEIQIVAPATLPQLTITAPIPFIENDFEAEVTLNQITVTAPAVFIQASAVINAVLLDVQAINPEAEGAGGGGADIDQVLITSPEPEITIDGTAREVLLSAQPVSVSTPDASVSVIATIALPEVSVVAPISDILSIGEGSIPEVTLTAPEPTVTKIDDFNQVFAELVEVTISSPEAFAEGSGSLADVGTVTVTAPEPSVDVEEFPTNIPVISVESPEGGAFTSSPERTLRVDAETRIIVVESDVADLVAVQPRRLVIEFEDRRIIVER